MINQLAKMEGCDRTSCCFQLFFLVFITFNVQNIVGQQQTPFSNDIKLSVDSHGGYSLNVGSTTWLMSAPTFVTAGGKTYSTDASASNKLVLKGTEMSSGHDNIGHWTSSMFMYELGTTELQVHMIIRQYDSFVIFEQHYKNETDGSAIGTFSSHAVCTGFPSFQIKESTNLGFMAYGGIMVGDTGRSSGKWGVDTYRIASGLDSGPLVLFDKSGASLIISPFNQFMAASAEYKNSTVSWGLIGSMKKIPKDFKYSTILYYGGKGARQTIEDWGVVMRTYYQKHESYRNSDLTVTHLGYWTDNGAYYYYNMEKNKTYEQTMLDVATFIKSKNLPFRYLQYDSWFYPKDGKTSRGGTLEWVGMPKVFPKGMQYVYNQTQMPVAAHNRWWSDQTPYAKSYNFIVEPHNSKSIPQDPNFWDYLMRTSKLWGLITYEQDWLNYEFDDMDATKQDVHVGRNWLINMGMGAYKNGLNIQYCMSPSRAALQSLEVPVVTQARVSNDYQPGEDNWMIGMSSMFADAIGIAPFKDDFWTTAVQPGNPYGSKIETHSALHSVMATLSTGPVGPSDAIDKFNVSLIMRSCNMDGLILKPSRPAFAINPQLWQMALNDGSGPEGHVYTTYSDISGIRFGIVIAAAFHPSYSYSLTPQHSGLGDSYMGYAYSYLSVGKVGSKFSTSNSLPLKGCTRADFCLYYISPPITIKRDNAMVEVVLYGEWEKWVPMSPQRVQNIEVTADNVHIYLRGASNEQVTFYVSVNRKMTCLQCKMNLAGAAKINVMENTCISEA